MVSTVIPKHLRTNGPDDDAQHSQGSGSRFIISLQGEDPRDLQWVVTMPPTFSLGEAVDFEQRIMACLTAELPFTSLVLDLSATQFIDSSGLGSLVICQRSCEQHGVAMVLKHVPEQVRLVMELTAMENFFVVARDLPMRTVPSPQVSTSAIMATHPSILAKDKRAMDIVGAVVGLAITTILTLPIAVAIKLEDGGPIFFKQVRCSWMGRRFHIWKFRSMVINAEALKAQVENQVEGALFKNENDPRITRVGRFLRRTSLDELPQFWNVLRGDMSLVGTRPPTPDEVEKYKIHQWQRLDVKPGMTGEWQVKGRSTVKNFEEVVQMDLAYQANWSLLYDLQLILKTIAVVFSKRSGAA